MTWTPSPTAAVMGYQWYNAFRDSPSSATWDSSVAILSSVDTKKLDAAVALCQKELATAARVSDTFAAPSAFGDLTPAASQIIARAKCTQVEGTVMWILRAHAHEPAAQRSKCEKQRRFLKKLGEQAPGLIHSKVRELMTAALKF